MTTIMKKISKGVVLTGESSDVSENLEGSLFHNSSTARIKSYIQGAVREVLTNSQSQVLTNKTIDADNNTISNLEIDNLKAGVLSTSISNASTDTEIPSAKAVYTSLSAQNEASEISFTPITNVAGPKVQDAIGQVQSNLQSHTGASSNVHGLAIGSSVVGTTDNQTLTTKTINADNNTISNLVTSNLKSGVLNTSTTLALASDTQIPSALAVKTYVDNNSGSPSTVRTFSQSEFLSVRDAVYISSPSTVSKASSYLGSENFIGFIKTLGSQIINFSENFESGSFATNSWTVVNGAQTNKFYIGGATYNTGTKSAYISSDGGTSNIYNSSSASVVWFYKDIAIPSGSQFLKFRYKVVGENVSFPYDFGRLIIDPSLTIVPVAGTDIPSSGAINTTLPATSNLWVEKSTDLSTYAGTTIRIIFGWINDIAGGTNPPIAIDNITIVNPGTCDVQIDGVLSGFSGLSSGNVYYLNVLGGISDSIPQSSVHSIIRYNVPVGIAISSTDLQINSVASAYTKIFTRKVATIKDIKTAGTSGGTATTGVWTARTLNTLDDPSNFITSLSSNKFTLPGGTYNIIALSPFGASANAAARARIKLRNTTDSADTILGMSGRTSFGTSDGNLFIANINGTFTISTSKQFEIQYFVNVAGTDSLGAATTDTLDAVYTTVIIEKLE